MTETVTCLADIDEKYDVFEPDQVLDAEQLNRLRNYLDDQTRLTRTTLFGVGIVTGLRIQLRGNQIQLGRGVAVTTDGDLLRVPSDLQFDCFKPYANNAPQYSPFFSNGVRKTLFELVRVGDVDAAAIPLSQFAPNNPFPIPVTLGGMIAILYLESYIQDRDLCTEAGCDNLGRDCLNNLKVLLVSQTALGELKETFDTPDSVGRALKEVVAVRAILTPAVNTVEGLRTKYATACSETATRLVDAWSTVSLPVRSWFETCRVFMGDLFTSDPTATWKSKLESIMTSLSSTPIPPGFQYTYEFLNDVTETWNAMRRTLLSDASISCPSVGAFPKHVLLGRIVSAAKENRTDFYPGMKVRGDSAAIVHARFLAQKLDRMIGTFKVPTPVEIKITPSFPASHDLEVRAIPYYYNPDIHSLWNHARTQRGLQRTNYSFLASKYPGGGAGGAGAPLDAPISGFTFFRIEGHVGMKINEALKQLKDLIKNKNLPFCVRALLLGTDKKVVVRSGARYSDLQRFHYVVRKGLHTQLKEVGEFNEAFKGQVEEVTKNQEGERILKKAAEERHSAVKTAVEAVQSKLDDRKYSDYRANKTWGAELKSTLRETSMFKQQLGPLMRTDFPTPFDVLISNPYVNWLHWLDVIIDEKNDKADDELMFSTYLAAHPGAEPLSGVGVSEVFFLLHGEDGKVVGDVTARPCSCCSLEDSEPEEPDLPIPDIRDEVVIKKGTQTFPPLVRYLDYRKDDFKAEIEQYWQKDLSSHKEYLAVFKDTLNTASDIFNTGDRTGRLTQDNISIADTVLKQKATEIDTLIGQLDKHRNQLILPTIEEDKRDFLIGEVQKTERAIAKTLSEMTGYIAKWKIDVKAGSDGFKAMTVAASAIERLNDKEAMDTLKVGYNQAVADAGPDFVKVLKAIKKNKGFP